MANSYTISSVIEMFWEIIPPAWHSTRNTIRCVAVEQFKMTVEQFQVLRRIWKGADEVSSLADIGQASRSSVSRVVDALVNKGLVERLTDQQDRRHIHLVLTGEGMRLMHGIYAETEKWLAAKFTSLSPDELELIMNAMGVLGKIFDLKMKNRKQPI